MRFLILYWYSPQDVSLLNDKNNGRLLVWVLCYNSHNFVQKCGDTMKKIITAIISLILVVCVGLGIIYRDTLYSKIKNFLQSSGMISFSSMEGSGEQISEDAEFQVLNTGEEYNFDAKIFPYREMLTDEMKIVYNQVYANAAAVNRDFALAEEISSDDLVTVMTAVYNDHPELFWLATSYKYYYHEDGTVTAVMLEFYDELANDLGYYRSIFDSRVLSVVNRATMYQTPIEKELYIHDAICHAAQYDESAPYNQSAYSALVEGKTVCAGYSRAFQYCLQRAGINCYYVMGKADNEDHAWNMVEIEDDFYNVDISWDDAISEAYGASVYPYFNLTDKKMDVDHTRGDLSKNLEKCTSTKNSYTNKFGATLDNDKVHVSSGSHMTGEIQIEEPEQAVEVWDTNSEVTVKPDGTTGGGPAPETPAEDPAAVPEETPAEEVVPEPEVSGEE